MNRWSHISLCFNIYNTHLKISFRNCATQYNNNQLSFNTAWLLEAVLLPLTWNYAHLLQIMITVLVNTKTENMIMKTTCIALKISYETKTTNISCTTKNTSYFCFQFLVAQACILHSFDSRYQYSKALNRVQTYLSASKSQ